MQKKTYAKNIRRTIRQTASRFGAIFAIVALGVGFLAGLLGTTPNMRYSSDVYFDETHLYDVRVVSPLGLTQDDADAIAAVDGVIDIMPAYSADMLVNNTAGDVFVARLHSVPLGTIEEKEPDGYLNRVEVLEGRLPVKEDECVIEQGGELTGTSVSIGDIITVNEDNKNVEDTLARTSFKVVGIVQSSYYFSMERESASVGNGTLSLILYTGEENFSADVYSHIFLSVAGAADVNTLHPEYDAIVQQTLDRIKEISAARCEIRYKNVKHETEQALADSRAELNEAKAEAEEKLGDARIELDEGQSLFAENEAKLSDAKKQIESGKKELESNRQTLPGKLSQSQAELIAGKQALMDAQAQYNQGKANLDEAEAQVKMLRTAFDSAKTAVNTLTPIVQAGELQLELLAAQVTARQAVADSANAAYESAKQSANYDALQSDATAKAQQYTDTQAALTAAMLEDGYTDETIWATDLPERAAPHLAARDVAKAESEAAAARFAAAELAVAPTQSAKAAADTELANAQATYNAAHTALQVAQTQLDEANALLAREGELLAAEQKVAAGKAELAAAETQIRAAEKQIAAGEISLSLAADLARLQLDLAEKTLINAEAEYEDGTQQLEDARQELAEGEAEYAKEKRSAEEKLADAEQQIADGEKALRNLEVPKWYLMTRDDNTSYNSFKGNVDKVEAIATIFPIFFFLVAALVALTTMTRMVEDERLQIGTMKALGYSKSSIMAKYIIYAMIATICGCIVGLAIGLRLFPFIIWNAYSMMYNLPKLHYLLNFNYILLGSGAAILCTLGATLNAGWSTLAESPATLMLPRAPKAGKRILLERLPLIWRRMKFTHKVTARNLFRYKKRFFMTVIGIAGCTALLVAGFGLHDSISDIVNKQFGEIFQYDCLIAMRNEESAHSASLQDVLNSDAIAASLRVHQEKGTVQTDGTSIDAYLFVPEEEGLFPKFVNLRTRLQHESVPLKPSGVVITEKLSERTGYSIGDTITIKNTDDTPGTFTITGIAENYVENYLYLPSDLYAQAFGKAPVFSVVAAQLTENTPESRDALGSIILKLDDVAALNFIDDLKLSFTNMMSKIDIIVVVLIVCAGLLAFVVLYNLTNINITERTKEIATIKVLGFFDKEVSAYVYRENVVLTLVGIAAGLVLGFLLHKFVILNVEVDMVMFGRTVKTMSYLYSSLLTMGFSLLVNFVMRKKLRDISMVESMKAPE